MKKKDSFFKLDLPDKVLGVDSSLLILFAWPLVLVILFLISLNLVLIPKITEIGEVNSKIESVKASTTKIKERNNYLKSVDQDELKKDSDYLSDAVLKSKQSYFLVEVIRGVADDFDYRVGSFSLSPGEIKKEEEKTIRIANSNNLLKMPVMLSLFGPEEKSLDLILALEKTLPILFIDKFDKQTSNGVTTLELVVYSYYLEDKPDAGIDKLSLNDLVLSKEESDLIKKISSFSKINVNSSQDVGASGTFQQYQRQDPFSL